MTDQKQTTSQHLFHMIHLFAEANPDLATATGAHSRCREASARFVDLLRLHGWDARNSSVDEIAVVAGVVHKVVFASGFWIDWTARQFDVEAPFPAIKPETELWCFAVDR